jgi:DNA invertase Pin-like site-specific DNA recombinase
LDTTVSIPEERSMPRPRKTWKPKPTAQTRLINLVAGYVRVSTTEQADTGFGLAGQREALDDYTRAAGFELVAVYEDAGLSGTLPIDERPGLSALLAAADAGEFDAVVTKASDRIGRSLSVASAVFDRLDASGIRFLSITEPELSTPLLRAIFSGVAADERRRILERTSAGRKQKASQGGYAGGRVPFGYQLVGNRKDAKWQIDEDAAAVVRKIFELRAAGRTITAIADQLNAEHIASPGGKRWHATTVFGVLDNPAYAGQRRWREGAEYIAAGEHEPIIDQQLFRASSREAAA